MSDNGLSRVLDKVRRQVDPTFGDAAALATELSFAASLVAKVRDNADSTLKQMAAEAKLFEWLAGYEEARRRAGLPGVAP